MAILFSCIHPKVEQVIEKVRQEMRRELGQNNLGLNEGDLLDMLLGDDNNTTHKP